MSGTPSSRMRPAEGSWNRASRSASVVFPAPDGPTSATTLPLGSRSDSFRSTFLASLGATASALHFDDLVERTLDALAAHLETHLDLDRILALAEPV